MRLYSLSTGTKGGLLMNPKVEPFPIPRQDGRVGPRRTVQVHLIQDSVSRFRGVSSNLTLVITLCKFFVFTLQFIVVTEKALLLRDVFRRKYVVTLIVHRITLIRQDISRSYSQTQDQPEQMDMFHL